MGIAFKLLLIGFGLIARLFYRTGKAGASTDIHGITVFETTSTSKGGRVTGRSFGFDFPAGAIFKLTRESAFDRFFKLAGISEEVQTGDRDFDSQIYIASDNAHFATAIKASPELRTIITSLFRNPKCKSISCLGNFVWIRFKGDPEPQYEILELTAKMGEILSHFKPHRLLADPFSRKVLAVECFIYGIAGYALSNIGEWAYIKEDVHLDHNALMMYGLASGLAAAGGLFILVALLFKGSSRGHRILVESAIILGLSVPVASVGAICDINKEMDRDPGLFLETPIQSLTVQEHRGKRGSISYTYHLQILQPDSAYKFPSEIEINSQTYYALNGSKVVRIGVKKGYLNYPWIFQIGK